MNTFEFANRFGYDSSLEVSKPKFPQFPMPFDFTSLNVSQIGNKYYENNTVINTKGFKVYMDKESEAIISDTNLEKPPIELKEVIIYSNQSVKEFEGFDLILFTSTNGVTLLQQYNAVEVGSNEIVMFLEIDNKTNIFGSVMRIKVGTNILRNKNLPYAEIIQQAHNKSITISSRKLKKLLKNGVHKTKGGLFSWILSSIGEVLSDTVQFITGGLGDLFFTHFPKALEKIKIEKKYWNPKEKGFDALFIPDSFETYVAKQKGKTNAEHKIINTFIKPFFKKIDALEDEVKGKLKAIKHVLPNKIYKRIKKTINYVFNQFEVLEGLFLNSEYGFLNLILTSLQAANAFICGLYNSLIDTISGIFQLIGLVFLGVKGVADFAEKTGYYASLTVEFIENSIEGILKINFLELFKELFFVPLKLVQKVAQFVVKQTELSVQEVHYYLGYIVGFIVETTISILFTGGTLTVDEVLLKTFKEPVELLLKGFKSAIKAAKSLLEKLMVAFKKILKALSNPKQLIKDFLKFLEELFGIGKKEVGEIDELYRNKGTNKHDGGIKLSRNQLLKFKKELELRFKELNLKVEVVTNSPKFRDRLRKWNGSRNTQGSFNPGPPPIIYVRKNCTQLTLQHEIWHLEDLKRLKQIEYKKTPNWKHEESVWNKIWNTNKKWTDEELVDSYWYYKRTSFAEGGTPIRIKKMEELLKKYPNRIKN